MARRVQPIRKKNGQLDGSISLGVEPDTVAEPPTGVNPDDELKGRQRKAVEDRVARGRRAAAAAQTNGPVAGFATQEEYETAVGQAREAAAAYYNSQGEIQLLLDSEYDVLATKIDAYETAHPDLAIEHGVSTEVGGGEAEAGDIPHPRPMLSLDKVTDDPKGMRQFVQRVTAHGEGVVVEPKMDGMAVRAVYEKGRLVQLVTRGNGQAGEDVTSQYRNINGEPIYGLPADIGDPDFTAEVRGEVFMSAEDFEASNDARVDSGKQPFANPRNATAGSLRREDPTYPVRMSFAAYDIDMDNAPHDNHTLLMASLDRVGFQSAQSLMPGYNPEHPYNSAVTSPKMVQDRIDALQTARDTLGFPIDGAVVSVDRMHRREEIGNGNRAPKWALAYKYPARDAASTVEEVQVEIGRTGRLSLRLRITPVEVDGSTVEYISGHNVGWLKATGVGVGSRIGVEKRGDVIPYLTGRLRGQNDDAVTPWREPSACPKCGSAWDKTTRLWRCPNPACGKTAGISYFAGRDQANIDGFSDSMARALVNSGKVNDVADLYSLSVDDIAEATMTSESGTSRQVGVTTARKVHAEIQKSKQQDADKIFAGLGIRLTGRTMSRRLFQHFGTLDAIRHASVEQLAEVDGIGVEKAARIHEGLAENADVIDRLVAAGVKTGEPVRVVSPEERAAMPLNGQTVVVTGAMSGPLAALKRNDMNELIEAKGGKSSGSVSKNTSLLVCGEPSSSKWRKAIELGVPVMTPEEFAAMIGYSQ